MRIAVLGAGSMGTIAGALIAKGGEDVTLIDLYKEHVDALNTKGAKITGNLNEIIPVKAVTPDQLEGYFDLVLFLTKQLHMKEALNNMLPHLKEDSFIVTLQNGIPEDAVVEMVGTTKVVGGSIGWGATFIEPGVSQLTSDVSGMTTIIGELDGKLTPRVVKAKEILSHTGKVSINNNLLGTKWTKLMLNCTSSGMSTVLGCTFGEVVDNFTSFTCQAYIGLEGAQVMSALGINPVEIHGYHPVEEKISFKNKRELAHLQTHYQEIIAQHRALKASMLQDIEKGRKTEINYINGKIVEAGIKANIPTPFNAKVVELVSRIQEGQLNPSWSNLAYFDFPVLPD